MEKNITKICKVILIIVIISVLFMGASTSYRRYEKRQEKYYEDLELKFKIEDLKTQKAIEEEIERQKQEQKENKY